MEPGIEGGPATPALVQIKSSPRLFGRRGRRGRAGGSLLFLPAWLAVSPLLSLAPGGGALQAQTAPASGASGNAFQGSVAAQAPTPGVRSLSLDEAIRMGLKYNLGLVLANEGVNAVRGQRLQQLQALLPDVEASGRTTAQQTDLQAEGLRIPGFPAVIGPYGYTDIRAYLQWSLLNLSSLKNYLAVKHNFAGAQLSAADARDMVALTVGNAYLLCVADGAMVQAAQSQVDTSKISLDQAVANHQQGAAPLLDELRARVDYQTQQQTLITANNEFEKDKLRLARVIGMPLEQKFTLADREPYAALDHLDPEAAVRQALAGRKDLQALEEQARGAAASVAAAKAERYPTASFAGDYGDIGTTLGHSHGTFDAAGSASVPLFEEAKLRGDAGVAQAQLNQTEAQLNDLRGQIDADVRDSILDIELASRQVQVALSNVKLAGEELSEAQQRYAAGVADNLAVSQAQASVAEANRQYVSSLYEHNIAKLSLARALGVAASDYKDYVGGK